MRRGLLSALWLATLLLAAGCSWIPSVGPDYEPPKVDLPESFRAMPLSDETARLRTWWEHFNDPSLNEVVRVALEHSPDLEGARARVRRARALRQIAFGGFFPNISVGGSVARTKTSANSRIGRQAQILDDAPVSDGESFVGPYNRYEAGFESSWEIDLFGGNRRAYEAANAEVDAATADLHDVWVALLAEVARTYIELRGFERRVQIVRNNIELQSETYNLVKLRFEAGLVSELDVAQSLAQLETTRSQLPSLEAQLAAARHRLAVLVGVTPEQVDALLPANDLSAPSASALLVKLPDLPGPELLGSGIPTELLRRRPDVRRAERQLAAQTARLGVAVADLFPSFTLGATWGYSSNSSGSLFEGDSVFWSLLPGVRLPIFTGGRLWGEMNRQEAIRDEALALYERTVLLALEETENALVGVASASRRVEALSKALEANRRALQLSRELYRQGLADFLRVLESERSAYAAEDALLESEVAARLQVVSLYAALGGGWDEQPTEKEPQGPSLEQGVRSVVTDRIDVSEQSTVK